MARKTAFECHLVTDTVAGQPHARRRHRQGPVGAAMRPTRCSRVGAVRRRSARPTGGGLRRVCTRAFPRSLPATSCLPLALRTVLIGHPHQRGHAVAFLDHAQDLPVVAERAAGRCRRTAAPYPELNQSAERTRNRAYGPEGYRAGCPAAGRRTGRTRPPPNRWLERVRDAGIGVGPEQLRQDPVRRHPGQGPDAARPSGPTHGPRTGCPCRGPSTMSAAGSSGGISRSPRVKAHRNPSLPSSPRCAARTRRMYCGRRATPKNAVPCLLAAGSTTLSPSRHHAQARG
jgi:hypothetical protein